MIEAQIEGCCGKQTRDCDEPTQEQLDLEEQKYCLDDFKEKIISKLTASCALPFAIPEQEVERIIDEAKSWFYIHYEDATEEQWLMLPWCEMSKHFGGIDTKINSNRGRFKLPKQVVSVVGVYEMGNRQGEAANRYLDVYPYNRIYSRGLNSYFNTVPLVADDMAYFTCMDSFFDLARQMTQYPLTFRYNRNTNNIAFLGHLPNGSVVLDVLFSIDDCSLFNDELFFRYVYAQCLVQMSMIFQRYQFQLPGNIQLNTDFGGDQMLQEIKEEINQMNTGYYFITT